MRKIISLLQLFTVALFKSHRIIAVCLQTSALIAVILVGVWMGNYRGGFAWHDDPVKQFNYHPLFMILGMIFLYGNGKTQYLVLTQNAVVWHFA